jgi:exonuclease SbcC
MIPQRLSVRNFLCYRENVPPLDFTGLHLACLCGANGHGKSALLDAITWSLWGRARGRTQDDLIYYGAAEARVELEFLSRGTSYRVIRSHARGMSGRRRAGVSDLQLQLLNGGDAQPISGNTVRETQEKIQQLIGLDYDTFINSAFLLQGRADEFTSKTPSDRKAVLASILGLDAYDRLQVRAREKLAEVRSANDQSEGALQQLRREVEELGDPSQELYGLEQYLQTVESDLQGKRRELELLRARDQEQENRKQALAEEQRRIDHLVEEIAQLEVALAQAQRRIEEYLGLVDQAPLISEGLEKLGAARQRFEELEEVRGQHLAYTEKRAGVLQAIDSRRVRVETLAEQLRRKLAEELTPRADAEAQLLSEQSRLQAQGPALSRQGEELASQRERQQNLANRLGEAKTMLERYKTEGEELGKKLALLDNPDGDQAVCALCGTSLALDACQGLAETYGREIKEKRDLYRQNQAVLKSLQSEKSDVDQALPQQEQALAGSQRELEVALNNVERQILESRQAQQELAGTQPRLASALASLESGEFAAEENKTLQELDLQIKSLGYAEDARQQSYAQMRELQGFEERQVQLSQARARLPEEEEALAQTRDMLLRRREELTARRAELLSGQQAQEALDSFGQLQDQLKAAGLGLTEAEGKQQTAIARRGYLEGQMRRREDLAKELDAVSNRKTELEEDQGIYQELATAFGRQGVQAMLIETVIPRLEEEGNYLLGQMTDNRMHLKLETQRERRSGRGEPIETLEINVSDELGPRSYEMYSGGEAFRVNLALRIALSKVLAQRMGAPLPTLFIDEGFGTQDGAGRERILDVISSIQHDFEKIIVITHLEDLKDMFPVRIEVQKNGDGSTFWLS